MLLVTVFLGKGQVYIHETRIADFGSLEVLVGRIVGQACINIYSWKWKGMWQIYKGNSLWCY